MTNLACCCSVGGLVVPTPCAACSRAGVSAAGERPSTLDGFVCGDRHATDSARAGQLLLLFLHSDPSLLAATEEPSTAFGRSGSLVLQGIGLKVALAFESELPTVSGDCAFDSLMLEGTAAGNGCELWPLTTLVCCARTQLVAGEKKMPGGPGAAVLAW